MDEAFWKKEEEGHISKFTQINQYSVTATHTNKSEEKGK